MACSDKRAVGGPSGKGGASASPPPYAELHCVSNFTFLRGASHPQELVERASILGYRAIAITDECSVAAVVRAHMAAQLLNMKLLIGAELRLECGLKLVVIAIDRLGYGRLCRMITRGRRAAVKGAHCLTRQDVIACGLEQCFILWIPGPQPVKEQAHWLRDCFGTKVRIAVELFRDGTDKQRLLTLQAIGRELEIPLVASGDVHMHIRERRRLQDALTAIRHNIRIADAGWHLYPNGERYLRERARLARLYPPELLAESVAVADACTFSLSELRYEYPHELVPAGQTPTSHLRNLVEEGICRRWPEGIAATTRASIENELSLIADMRYEPYFLTVHDIVAFARDRKILCQGRGSAANSLVCYCLGVSAVGPERGAALLFERFISRERGEPPDIDIDFEHDRREEVIQYIYRKYGRDRAAIAATVIMYRPRSALRDMAKVFGLDPDSSARLSKVMQWWDGSETLPDRVREAGFDTDDPVLSRIVNMARQLVEFPGFPRHLSQHVGGFVISEGVLEELVPIENATMPERTVVQWDKDDLNDLGLLKVDVLGLGMLSALRRAFALVNDFRGAKHALGQLPDADAKVYEMISRADTIGVFQIESRAQMSMLPRLKPAKYYDLVIEVAIVRPGPIQGDMVHPYLRRRNKQEPVEYPNREVAAVLERTLGVPIFQEQVMQLAIVAAGFSPGEADRLRRAMGAWKRSGGIEHFKDELLGGMAARNYSADFAQRIYRQMLGFGEYGFPECVVGTTRVVNADTGRWLTIEDMVAGKVNLQYTLACDEELRLRKRKVLNVMRSGEKPVWRLYTALGHSIDATAEHPFMTMTGWRKLGDIRAGEYVASARCVPVAGRRRWLRHQILVLADLIAQGNLCHPSTFYFYATQRWHCDEFVRAVERFSNTCAVVECNENCYSVRVRRIDRTKPVGAVTWLRALGVWGCGARAKFIPDEVFELCNSNIALLLARMWEGDGSFSSCGHASYDTASRRLGLEVQHLLLRLGILSRLYRRARMYRGRLIEHHVVTVTGDGPLRLFWRYIGRRFLDQQRARQSKTLSKRRYGRMSRDIIPVIVRDSMRRARDASGLSWVSIGRKAGPGMREIQARTNGAAGKGGCRRNVIGRLASVPESAELSRLATSDLYWDRVVSLEPLGTRETYDLQIEANHNFLANNLVVHNSHAASFALLVYDSSWLKYHEPAAFTCALLNSQPMGFYGPAQLVRDARAHGVEVRPVDVRESAYECTLERREDGEPALRLGMRMVKSLSEAGGKRIEAARSERNFESAQDLGRRAALDRGDLEALAAAGALAALSGNRHLAYWEVAGTERSLPLAPQGERAGSIEEGRPLLQAPTEGQCIVADYASVGLTLGRHPMALLRGRLTRNRLLTAADLGCVAHGNIVRTAGIVLMRQRPQSANGVTFLTLEDESGQVNVIVWESVGREQRRALIESRLLEIQGELQRQEGIQHVIARRLIDRSELLGELLTRSRDFH
jgi:DNA-directed DNA polymerase III PolC